MWFPDNKENNDPSRHIMIVNRNSSTRNGIHLVESLTKQSYISWAVSKAICYPLHLDYKSYCWRHFLLMSSNVEKSAWCPTRSFTPTTSIHGSERYYTRLIMNLQYNQLWILWPTYNIHGYKSDPNGMVVTNHYFVCNKIFVV